ncbi:uncharacterized protein LOC128318806 [Pangasianodon hypophthalmus]|uniref:uncharacterized protein LOC128318806 n=1 Tax=Pangasianodon hypophthalmus TaxID=310915 RepID=UPI0023082374|nr:uncharacterized protein LOC128318806 [Pangasianodon hypophthalmus]
MAKLLSLFTLQLLFGVFWPNLLQIASTNHLSVHPGENITLLCNITNYSEILWYRLRSEEVKLLISAEKGRVKKKFLLSYNVNESHFDITESSSSVGLVIIGVRETDLGFYYCGGRNKTTHIQFGKPIRLNFTEDQHRKTDNSSEPPHTQQSGSELWITVCVCLCVSVLINFICIYMFCCRLKGKSVPSCSCCSNTTDSAEKEENMHYASIQHKRRSSVAAKKNTASDLDSVTYATVASQPRRHKVS